MICGGPGYQGWRVLELLRTSRIKSSIIRLAPFPESRPSTNVTNFLLNARKRSSAGEPTSVKLSQKSLANIDRRFDERRKRASRKVRRKLLVGHSAPKCGAHFC